MDGLRDQAVCLAQGDLVGGEARQQAVGPLSPRGAELVTVGQSPGVLLELADAEQLRLDGLLVHGDPRRALPRVTVLGFVSTRSPATRAQHCTTLLE
jgi:hypothetical protein